MANESLRATLTQALNEYTLERGRILGRIQDARDALNDTEANLRRSQEAERSAIAADDEAVRKARELLEYYNSLPDTRPQALLEQQNILAQKQQETHRQRVESHGPVHVWTSHIKKRKAELAATEQDLKAIDARIQETNDHIARLG